MENNKTINEEREEALKETLKEIPELKEGINVASIYGLGKLYQINEDGAEGRFFKNGDFIIGIFPNNKESNEKLF